MGKKLTEEQEMVAGVLGKTYQDLLWSRNRLNKEARAWVEREVKAERSEFAQHVLAAHERHGMTVAQIGRAMGTSSRNTVYGLLEQARKENM